MLRKEKFLISGMSCGHCEKAVSSELTAFDGVKSVSVSAPGGFAEVLYDDLLVSSDMLVAAINDTGMYTVTEVQKDLA